MRKLILLSLLFCAVLVACNDDDVAEVTSAGKSSKRVKQITGENHVWGKYRIDFSYDDNGNLKKAWRLEPETGDTVGMIDVSYDLNYYKLSIIDYVQGMDEETMARIKRMYPDTWQDSVREALTNQTLCSVEWKDGKLVKKINRPRKNMGSGEDYDPQYVQVTSHTYMAERSNGKPTVVRCYDDVYGAGEENSNFQRTLSKYEFAYEEGVPVNGVCYFPDTYSETSWRKVGEMSFNTYAGIVTGVESEDYWMRRGKNKVVVAEPGKNYTYTLDEEGLAVRLETSDGETAVYEYEQGSGNFYELFVTPLEQVFEKVWVR